MKRRASPLLIGTFVVAGLAALALALVVVAGGKLFQPRTRAVMHFEGSVYGLQVGAPVVFRGVRVGSVTAINVYYDVKSGAFEIPVVAQFDQQAVRSVNGPRPEVDEALQELVDRGLSAQLSLQSLITGQLYVDLDLRPGRLPTKALPRYADAVEIPTAPTAIQNLKTQLDQIDFKKLGDDVAAIARSAREVLSGPELKHALNDIGLVTGNARKLMERLNDRIDPLADTATRALDRVDKAAVSIDQTARSVTGTSERVSRLVAPDSKLVTELQATAEQLSQTASALRRSTAEDGGLLRNTERAMQDLSRAARQLRDLAETIENNPESLLRGRTPKD